MKTPAAEELLLNNGCEMRIKDRPHCYLCGEKGQFLHQNLIDRVYEVSGEWALQQCANAKCGLVWLDPMPIEEDIGKAYRNYFTHSGDYQSTRFQLRERLKRGVAGLTYGYQKHTPLSERLLAFPLLFIPFLQQQSIVNTCMYLRGERLGKLLEIGFGSGILLNNLRALGWEVEGLEFDLCAVEEARKNFNLNVKAGLLTAQKYPDNSFDAIVLSHVIEHVHDPLALLAECRRILKPGGKLSLLTPNIESFGHQKFGAAWFNLEPPRHLYLFSLNTIQRLAERSGLKIHKLTTSVRCVNVTWLMSRQIEAGGKCPNQTLRPMSWSARLRAKIFQCQEALLSFRKIEAGEEIVLIAAK